MKSGPDIKTNPVSYPEHYTAGAIQPIEYFRANGWSIDNNRCNIIKYLTRFDKKGKPLEDLKKARQYLDWLIEDVEENLTKGQG